MSMLLDCSHVGGRPRTNLEAGEEKGVSKGGGGGGNICYRIRQIQGARSNKYMVNGRLLTHRG